MIISNDRQTNPALEEVVRRLVELFEPERIYLFGSQARGEASGDSDYDVMVVVPESDQPTHKRAQKAYSVLWGVGIPVEVIVFTREQFLHQSSVVASLAATVQREGRVLYEH
jgi:uncharacterized protein